MQTNHFVVKFGHILLFLLLCGILGLAGTTSGMAQPAIVSATGELYGYHIPFTFDPLLSPQIIIQVSINGQEPLSFWVDTGLETSLLIDTQAANKLKLVLDKTSPEVAVGSVKTRQVALKSVAFVGNGPDSKELASIPIVGLQTALVGDMSVIQDAGLSKGIAGIIGINVLNSNTVQFDFASKKMTLYTIAHPPLHIAGVSSIPMKQHKGSPYYFINFSPQKNINTELLIDTGAEGSGIPVPVARRLQPEGSASIGTGTFYGLLITPFILLASVQIGDFVIEQVSVTSETKMTPAYPLGLDILARFRVTLDFPNHLMLLERPKDYAQRVHTRGYTGLRLIERDNGYIISGVDEGSPAQKAGAQTGDKLLQVDGKALKNLDYLMANALLNGFAETHAALTLQRTNGQSASAAFDRLSIFARSLPVDGLFLDIPAHKPMEVIGLLKGCAGEQAGVKQGDIILEFNEHPTQEITPNILADEYKKPLLTLKVQRKGIAKPLSFTWKAQAKAK